jgi:hypothetical protein
MIRKNTRAFLLEKAFDERGVRHVFRNLADQHETFGSARRQRELLDGPSRGDESVSAGPLAVRRRRPLGMFAWPRQRLYPAVPSGPGDTLTNST